MSFHSRICFLFALFTRSSTGWLLSQTHCTWLQNRFPHIDGSNVLLLLSPLGFVDVGKQPDKLNRRKVSKIVDIMIEGMWVNLPEHPPDPWGSIDTPRHYMPFWGDCEAILYRWTACSDDYIWIWSLYPSLCCFVRTGGHQHVINKQQCGTCGLVSLCRIYLNTIPRLLCRYKPK